MIVNQIAVFIENKKGMLYELTSVLGRAGVDLVALSIADTHDFGIVRLITKDNALAIKTLKEAGFTAAAADLLGVEVEDKPNGLAEMLKTLEEGGIDIEYLYSFSRSHNGKAMILLKVDDTDKAAGIIDQGKIETIKSLSADE